MSDDVVIAKAAIIERCVRRAREERAAAGAEFATDFTRQDAAILNVEGACEAAIDIAFRLARIKGLGAPAASRDAIDVVAAAGFVPMDLAARLKRMVGFRNIATHRYDELDLAVVEGVIATGLSDLEAFAAMALRVE